MVSREKYFTFEHINTHRFNTSLELTEQAIHCLELVTELVEEGLDFQFKGGNSLLLILNTPQRFSIDVDIATDLPPQKIEDILEKIIKKNGIFYKWEKRQHKTKPWIPLSSYYLYYKSIINDKTDTNIMLDVQLHLSPYSCKKVKVECGEIFKSDVYVNVPEPESIIGDKMLTIGTNTLGIPVGKGKSAQRLKHIFDISRLLELSPTLSKIRKSFLLCMDFEKQLQNKNCSLEEIIRDSIECCYAIKPYFEHPIVIEDTKSVIYEHSNGFSQFASHLFSKDYSWQKLRYDMSKVAFCFANVNNKEMSDGLFLEILNKNPFPSEKFWEYVESFIRS